MRNSSRGSLPSRGRKIPSSWGPALESDMMGSALLLTSAIPCRLGLHHDWQPSKTAALLSGSGKINRPTTQQHPQTGTNFAPRNYVVFVMKPQGCWVMCRRPQPNLRQCPLASSQSRVCNPSGQGSVWRLGVSFLSLVENQLFRAIGAAHHDDCQSTTSRAASCLIRGRKQHRLSIPSHRLTLHWNWGF